MIGGVDKGPCWVLYGLRERLQVSLRYERWAWGYGGWCLGGNSALYVVGRHV